MERMQVYCMTPKFNAEQMRDMESQVGRFLQGTEMVLVPPVDIFKFATELGFDVRGADFEGKLDGLIIADEYSEQIRGFRSNKVIAYDCYKPMNDIKFIVAHELAHYIVAKTDNPDGKLVFGAKDRAYGSYSVYDNEQKMDYIGASLLVPFDDLSMLINEKPEVDSKMVALRYRVSAELAERRIAEVKAMLNQG